MLKDCKLTKAIVAAAIPRRVNAVCQLTSQGRVYHVAGANGNRNASRGFTTAAGFAHFIRNNYPVVAR